MRKCVREKERKREREILVCIHNPTGVDSWCERRFWKRKCVREKERKRERDILVCIHNPTGVDSWCEREILQAGRRD